ncbi:hypothetical protein K435DRAFT_867022 [Dendrothele bispora CBS 962.96]|uniref:Uncharacterized protein n=1 Tax=Dendrothele bispora (strain CBS 962.96) TaxID=1314807 RepID=A0A4S8LFA3_DENBC|nr:hypothetical protein K435DRAFT_867022 [Dendrothele bispora CBS 962.96]
MVRVHRRVLQRIEDETQRADHQAAVDQAVIQFARRIQHSISGGAADAVILLQKYLHLVSLLSKRPLATERVTYTGELPTWAMSMKEYLIEDLESYPEWMDAIESLVSLEASFKFNDFKKILPTVTNRVQPYC